MFHLNVNIILLKKEWYFHFFVSAAANINMLLVLEKT